MKKTFGMLLIAFMLCMILPAAALAEGEGTETPAPETSAPDTKTDSTDLPEITPTGDSKAYKEMLMDSFDQTLLGQDQNLRNQLTKILFLEEITVTADNYRNIVKRVNEAISKQTLSEGASLDRYTDEDFQIAAELIRDICTELELDCSIDPSNDSQNEYAKVITIKKNGKVLGQINSDAKTDVANSPEIGWIIGGGVLIAAAAAFGLVLLVKTAKKRKEA